MLYEMLAGRNAFQRETSADTISAILKEDPPDLPAAERRIPAALVRIVERCLEKDPAGRFQTAADLAFSLESLSSQSDRIDVADVERARPPRPTRARLGWMVAAVLALALVAVGIPAEARPR